MRVKGEKTKKLLCDHAKYIFYHKGYDKAMIKEIVDRAGSHLGVFTYYFKNKEELGMSIFDDFISGVSHAIQKNFKSNLEIKDNIILLNMIEYRAYYKCIMSGSNIQNFYCDITRLPAYPAYIKKSIREFLQRLIKEDLSFETRSIIRDPAFFNAVVSIASGMELQFFRDFINKEIEMEYDDAVDLFFTEYYHLILEDKLLIQNNLRKSRKIVDNLTFSVDEAFNVTIETDKPA